MNMYQFVCKITIFSAKMELKKKVFRKFAAQKIK
jgi:hypothetical protein